MKKIALGLGVLISSLSATTIPLIDMEKFVLGTKEERKETAIAFGKALEEIGFVAVTNIGIDYDRVDNAYKIGQKYFSASDEIKMKNYTGNGLNGYIPFAQEHAKNSSIPNLMEMYQTVGISNPPALWPTQDLPQFKPSLIDLYFQAEECAKECLRATAIYLGYEDNEDILANLMGSGNSVMRLIHYPPVNDENYIEGAIRAREHEDICIMTVIPKATARGLQVKLKDGTWIYADVPEGAAVINSGDTLSRLTNYKIPSTTHRVVNPPVEDKTSTRFSVPFFGQPALSTTIRVLDKCIDKDDLSDTPEDISFGELLMERLRAIGLSE